MLEIASRSGRLNTIQRGLTPTNVTLRGRCYTVGLPMANRVDPEQRYNFEAFPAQLPLNGPIRRIGFVTRSKGPFRRPAVSRIDLSHCIASIEHGTTTKVGSLRRGLERLLPRRDIIQNRVSHRGRRSNRHAPDRGLRGVEASEVSMTLPCRDGLPGAQPRTFNRPA